MSAAVLAYSRHASPLPCSFGRPITGARVVQGTPCSEGYEVKLIGQFAVKKAIRMSERR
ncbi:hypothetical protein JYU34_017055 [Plutella xylostella]|uniref:Uncharacterized protein n=1 Tax=Plutella xylostella TaxID=51655 RepID=A0ABQ7Q447_PLUXY|nr:hypothetical protein JYU34_017055 [Plutella xylostella]